MNELIIECPGQVGLITLNRPHVLNALSLQMVRDLTAQLLAWRDDPAVLAVAIRGCNKDGDFGAFCAGGDIRALYQAALQGSTQVGDFFTLEYILNHLVQTYPKPYIALMDGVVMGGGMGLVQGSRFRLVTERTRMAMPETRIGLFPDVGGGYFLSRCPGRVGEYLGLSGHVLGAAEAVNYGLADAQIDVANLAPLWRDLAGGTFENAAQIIQQIATYLIATTSLDTRSTSQIDAYFSLGSVGDIIRALEASSDPWALDVASTLRQRSPLMLHVTLEQIRRARSMTLADDLRMERGLVQHCFGSRGETVEGIRALIVDKDHLPRWNPARIEYVTPQDVAAFFVSPWTQEDHPLRSLSGFKSGPV